MTIVDDIKAQLSASLKRYDYRVYVGGLLLPKAGPPRFSSSLDNIYDSMTIPIAVWDDALLVEGNEVVVEEGINGFFIRTFTGEIQEPDRADFPTRNSILAVDRMWRATLEGGVATQWAFEDETQIIKDLLTVAGVPYTDDGIEGGGWTLGTRQPILLASTDAPETLMRDIDRLAGFRTRSNRNGEAVRIELPRFPGATENAAFAYADNPVSGELGVLDNAQTSGSGRSGIRNRIRLNGPNLFGLSQVNNQQIDADIDQYVSLWYSEVVPESVTVTDISGDVTYIRSDGVELDPDYEVDGPNGAIRALSTGAIVDGESLLVTYNYELTDGLIESTISADNQYLPANKYITENVPGGIVQDLITADAIVDRLGLELNRTHDVVTIPVEANILLEVGQTVSYRDAKIGYPNATPFMVTAIDREFNTMVIRLVGGDGGPVGTRDPRPPRARFLPQVFRFGDFVRVYVDGIYSWDPDGDIVSYAWEDTEANVAAGVTTEFDYPFSLGSVSISLVVTDALGLVSPVYTREIDFANPDFVLDVFARWKYDYDGPMTPGENVSVNTGVAPFLGRWFGDETAQGIQASAAGTYGYGALFDIVTPLSPYFNRQRFALAMGGWGWYPTYTIDRYAELTEDPSLDYVFTTFDGQKKLLADVEWAWQWWDSDLAMGAKDISGPSIKVSVGNTNPLSNSQFTRIIPNARMLSRGLGEKLWKVWFGRENPAHIMIASEAYLFESLDQGATWHIVVSSEEAFGSNTARISSIAHAATTWAVTRYTAVPTDDPVFFDNGDRPAFPENIIVRTISASPSADRYIVNDIYLLEQVAGVWTVAEITYYESLDPDVPEDTLFFDGTRLPIFHPIEDDIIVISLGGGWRAYLLYPDATALRAAEGSVTTDPAWNLYVDSSSAISNEQVNVAVMSHAKPPVDPVTVLSSTSVKVFLGDPPDGWLNTGFDTSGWDNAIIVG